jgi:RHS repeat-associated protein
MKDQKLGAGWLKYPRPVLRGRPYVKSGATSKVLAIQSGGGVIGGRKYLHANHLYSTAAVTDAAGQVVERYKYDSYGRRTVLSAGGQAVAGVGQTTVGFTGRTLDEETGLWYFRSRMYSDKLGRFIGRDSRYFNGFNLYDNFSVNFVDPWGMYKCSWVVVCICPGPPVRRVQDALLTTCPC